MGVSACPVSWLEEDKQKAYEYLSGKRDGELLSPYREIHELLTLSNGIFPPKPRCRNHITMDDAGLLILTVHANGEIFNITLDSWKWTDSHTELQAARAEIVEHQRKALN